MKRLLAYFLCLFLICLSCPISANATSSDTEVISTHGSKTYMGTEYDWNETWDSDNFTDVTEEDIDTSADLIIKSGKVGDVTVSDGADLTIKGGTMSDVSCEGTIEMWGGKASSLESSEDIEISGGTVTGDVDSDDEVTLSGELTVGGTVSGADITVYASNSDGSTKVTDGLSFSDKMILEGSYYTLGTVDGQDSGTLEIEDCSGLLPEISDVYAVSLDSGSKVTTSESFDVDTLSISDDSEFIADSSLSIGTITGPGILVFDAGNLTINTGVSDSPIFDLNGTAKSGVTAFQAESGTVSASDVTIFGYDLTKNTYSSSYDSFVLTTSSGNGVTLNSASLDVTSGSFSTITATVTPALSELSSGTQLCWKLIDPSSQFTITPNSNNNSCSVGVSSSSSEYRATLVAYLADSSGNILSSYKTAACNLTATSTNSSSANTTVSSTTNDSSLCDTHSTVIIKNGNKYQARITSSSYPSVVSGTGGIVSIRLASKSENNYYFAFTGIKAGFSGIYINGSLSPVFICNVN